MLQKSIALIATLFFISGCKPGSDDSNITKACTLMGSSTTMVVRLTSPTALPTNLAVGFNGTEIDVDECENNPSFFGNSIEVSDDRLEAIVVFQLNGDADDKELYFPSYDSEPISNLVNLDIFSRTTCSDTFTVSKSLEDQEIEWDPVYVNGKSCGVTSYTGDSNVSVD